MEVKEYTLERVRDVVSFERRLRQEEDFWGWAIDDAYVQKVTETFSDPKFSNAVSLLAYDGENVVGRIDATLISSRFDGGIRAYLDWICVLKSCRHQGAAQMLMAELRRALRERYGADTLVGLIAANPEAQRFYRALEGAEIRDEGIWIDL